MKPSRRTQSKMTAGWPLRLIRNVHRCVTFPFRVLVAFWSHPIVRAVLRVSMLVIVLALVIAGFGVRSAKGDLAEQGLVIGRQLAKLEDLTATSTQLVINGQSIQVASAHVDRPMNEVLDRFQGVCESETAIGDEFMNPKTIVMKSPTGGKVFAFGALRNETNVDGVVACIMKSAGHGGRTFVERLKKFAESSDFGDLGLMRYAYAQKTETGGTHVITVWTNGSFKFDALMPPVGEKDALGSDARGAVRPPSSVRYITAEALGHPHSVRLYESKRSVPEVLAHYDREMSAQGWKPVQGVNEELGVGRFFTKARVLTMVFVGEHEGRVSVTVVQTPE